MSKTPERFGKGAIEGVAASESADNAVVPSSFVPLFALGIPGSVIAAILISAFVIHGITPGPMMFVEDAEIVQSLYAAMIVASFALLGIGLVGQSFFAWVIRSPMRVIAPAVLFFCVIGSFMQGGGLFGIGLMVLFAVLGVLAKKLDFSFVTFLIGFVIGPSLELTLRQSIPLLDRDIANLAQHPVAAVFIGLTIVLIAIMALAEIRRRNRASRRSETPLSLKATGRNT
ncbi:tripartite tricarboxylate transporter permease, partial [Pseudooceanicola sp.]|uniref:tripartite tricarboxylate transporter permease n=1 Tax=Pseudooceanicola sp. TaxID=1914328 RepID=UPI00405A4A73